ncbi:MAG TPA: HTTM domain-containing protein [Candidatus Acidoferrales bacterium]|nr:HTTM domain-containing protein [Candidatus Acidoferrales bacterium]
MFKKKLGEIFGADLRSLAALRICLALLILIDLLQRSRDLVAHYSDAGVLPRSVLLENLRNRWHVSLHLINGTWEAQAVLFLIAGIFALAFLVGYRTRITGAISWFLLISLQNRNPVVAEGADVLLRVTLFWALFLPLGARYSLDSVKHPQWERLPGQTVSWASFAYLMQVIFVYWFSLFHKYGPEWRVHGTAVYYALSLDHLTTPLGDFLLQFPSLLRLLSFGVLGFEAIGPLLLLSPLFTAQVRSAAILGFVCLHLGFASTLQIGLFPWIGIVAVLALLPAWFWDKIFTRLKTADAAGTKIYYDQDCGFCQYWARAIKTFFLLPETPILPASADAAVRAELSARNSWVVVDRLGGRHFGFRAGLAIAKASPILRPLSYLGGSPSIVEFGERVYRAIANHRKVSCPVEPALVQAEFSRRGALPLTEILVGVLLLYVFWWNVATLPKARYRMPERFRSLGYMLRLDQTWRMFAPSPLKDDGWYVVPGRLSNGTVVDIFANGKKVEWDRPADMSETYTTHRWRKYMMNLWRKAYRRHSLHYARYLCRSWNATHGRDEKLEEVSVFFMLERTLPDYQAPERGKALLINHKCDEVTTDAAAGGAPAKPAADETDLNGSSDL